MSKSKNEVQNASVYFRDEELYALRDLLIEYRELNKQKNKIEAELKDMREEIESQLEGINEKLGFEGLGTVHLAKQSRKSFDKQKLVISLVEKGIKANEVKKMMEKCETVSEFYRLTIKEEN